MTPERQHLIPEPAVHSPLTECLVEGECWYEVDDMLSRRSGHHWPVRLSRGAASLVAPSAGEQAATRTAERLRDLLWVAAVSLLDAGPEECFVPLEMTFGRCRVRLWGCIDITEGLAVHILDDDEV